jgi:3-methyl-2-oxobutanoate hydroxymethyltransferase
MKITENELRSRKSGGPKIVMCTCYDFPTACLEDECGVDVQLIGDSVGTNVLGCADVSEVTVADMIHHVKAVGRGARRSFVICDMPFNSFQTPSQALDTARRFIEAGADGIKMEGEEEALEQVRHVASSHIPVCAHIGYTPQTDGIKATVQGKDLARAQELITIARKLEKAGAFMIVLELIPQQLAAAITAGIGIPTIGIGAGKFCDGQVQVIHDIAGMSRRIFRHAKAYADLGQEYERLLKAYIDDVRSGSFPTEKNAAQLPDAILRDIEHWLATQQ